MDKKSQLGQFFTKNTSYILQGLEHFIAGKMVTDPFAGNGDLLDWAEKNGSLKTIGYDIDINNTDNSRIYYNDSLANPKEYDFILTNPPYLYQNKMQNNSALVKTKHTDLFQLSLEKIMESKAGIVIVPINFLCSDNSKYIRELFLEKFNIVKANYFTEQVFADTSYNVMVFYYERKQKYHNKMNIQIITYPEKRLYNFYIYQKYNWKIGGEFLAEVNNSKKLLQITRLEESDIIAGDNQIIAAYNHFDNLKQVDIDDNTLHKISNNIILLKAIDTGTKDGIISLESTKDYKFSALISKQTSRNQIHIIIEPTLPLEQQQKIIEEFNKLLNQKRQEYNSLFMTNFRDKGRKRISFSFTYNLINYIYAKNIICEGDNYAAKQLSLFTISNG